MTTRGPARSCECGSCRKCTHREYMRAYYRRPGVAARMRETARQSRERRLERVRAYDRARGHRSDPEKSKVRSAAWRVHREPQPCEVCDALAERHHEDYSKPLEIRWLCRAHHAEAHHAVA